MLQHLDQLISNEISKTLNHLWGIESKADELSIQLTRKEFVGDRTFVVFPYLKQSKLNPEETGKQIGEELLKRMTIVKSYNVIKGFLNIEIADQFWVDWMVNCSELAIELKAKVIDTYMVEFSSPNTNKPLHLGHIRNNLLGFSVSRILESRGHTVIKTQVINDRGIHICKSMVAWKKYGNNETPESSAMKGDHLVGKYYVKYDQVFKSEVEELVAKGLEREEAEKQAPILLEARQMLVAWENKNPEVYQLWVTMNGWVYQGFDETYRSLSVDFDKLYYESNTYLVGKDYVLDGLKKGIFYQNEDGSIWVDLANDGLDQKILLRSDGTSVYMTQDIGTAVLRFEDFPKLNHLIYTVGNEQNYHFKVLFLILQKLGYAWAKNCKHLSYGMVELPTGKMKSREGTVVDADDLIEEMIHSAKVKSEELGKLDGLDQDKQSELYRMIGLAALKYYILKVDPLKQMVFNPEESIDFNGNTGPFIQYTHARISTLLRKSDHDSESVDTNIQLSQVEKEVLKQLYLFPETVQAASEELNPAVVANYIYELVKLYNQFYQSIPILKETDAALRNFRLRLSQKVSERIKSGMYMLGMDVPTQM